MLINQGPAIYAKDGKVVDGPGEGVSLLVAENGRVDEATAERHKIKDRLTPESEVELTADFTGDPYVLVNGRAVAKSLLQDPNADAPPRRRDGGGVKLEPADSKAVHASATEDDKPRVKHIPGPKETKSVS